MRKPEDGGPIGMMEGPQSYLEAIDFLKKQEPLPALVWSPEL